MKRLLLCMLLCLPATLFAASDSGAAPAATQWQFLAITQAELEHAEGARQASGWRDVELPHNWALDNDKDTTAGWYRLQFAAPAHWSGRLVSLEFEGVDYFAELWLNGQLVAQHEGLVDGFTADLNPALKVSGSNELLLRVRSPHEPPQAWSLRKKWIKGIFAHHDTRPGGAWSDRGQEFSSGGVFGEVHWWLSQKLAVRRMRVLTAPQARPGEAVDVDVEVEIFAPAALQRVKLLTEITPAAAQQAPVQAEHQLDIRAGTHWYVLKLRHPEPQFWWPVGLGEAVLYQLDIGLSDGASTLDKAQQRFAFRTVQFDEDEQLWRINGQPVFLRGTNYIGDLWLARMDERRYRRDLQLMLEANVNAVRVHAHTERDRFYQLADEMGLLIWQDFPLQWGYEDSDEFQARALQQLEEMFIGLGNHPSIMAWTLHNEPPWDADWMKYKYPDYQPGQNQALDEILAERARELDASRDVQPTSTTGSHPWLGWYSGTWLDYAKPTELHAITEFGAQALPDEVTLRGIFPGDKLWPQSESDWDLWKYHNFQPRENFEIAGIERGDNLAAWVENSQHYQARLNQLAAESYRRQRFAPVSAIFHFLLNESWPSINWGIVDYKRRPKSGYHALAQAYQTSLPVLGFDHAGALTDKHWPLELITDQALPPSRLELLVSDADGALLYGWQLSLPALSSGVHTLGNLVSSPGVAQPHIQLDLVMPQDHQRYTNHYQLEVREDAYRLR